ncbi:MAG: matrixin family metalloprotease [Cyanobium sp. CZS 25K]|nr:matrixin family metalloprotease [Cyanobium sp. CZS25K]
MGRPCLTLPGLRCRGGWLLAAAAAGALLLPALAAEEAQEAPAAPLEAETPTCAPSRARRPVEETAEQPLALESAQPASGADYRHRLRPTHLGWARLDHWCVWVEPAATEGPAQLWDQRWLAALERALGQWQQELAITRVEDPAAAQVRILRRRPPLLRDPSGRTRASHGRAQLAVVAVERGAGWILEPQVQVLISPGQRAAASEATALHELGHAFGLWGHSDDPADAMAAIPGARPVLELSPRDRATVRWLYQQPTRFGQPLPSPASGQEAAPASP